MSPTLGHRVLRLEDARRQRPVLVDLWYPAAADAAEAERAEGTARGRGAEDAPARADRHPLVLLSHGAFGAARNYTWISEHLARSGYIVAGISHFRESPVYGAETIDPRSASQPWHRVGDCSFVLDRLLADGSIGERLDADRIGALGHSSGGATVIALGGATYDPVAMARYCASEEARGDRGCAYGAGVEAVAPPPEASADGRDPRVRAIVALDPALGPGHDPRRVTVPVHVVGAVDNDFLPFEAHAGRYARLIPGASLTRLDHGEGHFVFLDPCTWEREANGVPLCRDRPGVDRARVHQMLRPLIAGFFADRLSPA